jgi:hypothetical protein
MQQLGKFANSVTNARIRSPMQESDLLICQASFYLSHVVSDLSTRSLLARSTKCRQLHLTLADMFYENAHHSHHWN